MRPRTTIALLAVCAIALAIAAYFIIALRRENSELKPRALKYDEICAGVKSALWVDITMLHDTDDPPRLTPQQVEDDRKHLLARVGSTIGGDDSYVMLGRCMPQPFPMDAWRACRDDACLRAILKQAMDSIQ